MMALLSMFNLLGYWSFAGPIPTACRRSIAQGSDVECETDHSHDFFKIGGLSPKKQA